MKYMKSVIHIHTHIKNKRKKNRSQTSPTPWQHFSSEISLVGIVLFLPTFSFSLLIHCFLEENSVVRASKQFEGLYLKYSQVCSYRINGLVLNICTTPHHTHTHTPFRDIKSQNVNFRARLQWVEFQLADGLVGGGVCVW